jgi:hypothetical protein
VWLTVELVAVLYLVAFAFFWSLCRTSAHREVKQERKKDAPSNLIPFERRSTAEMKLRKTARGV